LKSKDAYVLGGISPENYSIGNEGIKVGIVYQPQIILRHNGFGVTVGQIKTSQEANTATGACGPRSLIWWCGYCRWRAVGLSWWAAGVSSDVC